MRFVEANYNIVLTDGEKAEIVVANGKVTIYSNGEVIVDAGTHGYKCDLFDDGVKSQDFAQAQLNVPTAYQPTKAERIGQYLYLLFEAQKANHNCHDEITEALKQYRIEAGI